MVERLAQSAGLEEVDAKVVKVTLEKNNLGNNESDQIHIEFEPLTVKIKGATGRLHEWVRFSAKASQTAVPEGSVLERYLSQLELLIPDAKKAKTVSEAFAMMEGRVFKFKKVKLGRAYEGRQAREVWTPVANI